MIKEFFRWRLTPNPEWREKLRSKGRAGVEPSFAALEAGEANYLIWLGHATVYGRMAGVHFITDPLFGGIMGHFARRTPCPIEPEELPGLELVLISHDHYDHLDRPSLNALERRFSPTIVVGLGLERWLWRRGFPHRRELDWWESTRLGKLAIFCFPVQHWSRRKAIDTDKTLWCGYSLSAGGKRLAFVGDSGYFAGFSELGRKLGPFDVAIMPIGPARPRRVMAPQHMDPTEACQAAADLRARVMIPTHFGTFPLGDEPLDEAPLALMEAAASFRARTGDAPEPVVLAPGASLSW
jgi:L-ascorbate metabolism protein UlaG (beta-lactamase superfamily)